MDQTAAYTSSLCGESTTEGWLCMLYSNRHFRYFSLTEKARGSNRTWVCVAEKNKIFRDRDSSNVYFKKNINVYLRKKKMSGFRQNVRGCMDFIKVLIHDVCLIVCTVCEPTNFPSVNIWLKRALLPSWLAQFLRVFFFFFWFSSVPVAGITFVVLAICGSLTAQAYIKHGE